MKLWRKALLTATIVLLCSISLPVFAQGWCVAPPNPEYLEYLENNTRIETQAQGVQTDAVSTSTQIVGVLQEEHPLGYVPPELDLSNMWKPSVAGNPAHRLYSASSLPSSYDGRVWGRMPPVRDQGRCGSCWAFGGYSSLECYLMPWETNVRNPRTGVMQPLDFSENNLKNAFSCCSGGNEQMIMAYLTRGSGPVPEMDDPYDDIGCNSPQGLVPSKYVEEILFLGDNGGDPLDNSAAKEAIMTYGGLYCVMVWDYRCYEGATSAFYMGESMLSFTSHAVCVVGWDDQFDRNKFKKPNIPPGDGAYIIRNSWGPNYHEGGYFYSSYYGGPGGSGIAFVPAPVSKYKMPPYQHDWDGWGRSIGWDSNGDNQPDQDFGWFANVFTASAEEKIGAVSFYTGARGAIYEVYVYTDVTTSPTQGTLVTSKSGTIEFSGYHTIALDQRVQVSQGQKFSVVVKLTTPGYYTPIAVESGSTVDYGQSYVRWSDLAPWVDAKTSIVTNVCLKALAVSCDTLSVSPVVPGKFSGPVGGPFTPADHVYTLSNTGASPVTWEAVKTQAWTTLSEPGGTLAAGETRNITVTVNAGANGLSTGNYTDSVVFKVVNGPTAAVCPVGLVIKNGKLHVNTQSGITANGPVGGPYRMSSPGYTIANTGYSSVQWYGHKNQSWLTLIPDSGILPGGESLEVSISFSTSLPVGRYEDTITFFDSTNGVMQDRKVVLIVGQQLHVSTVTGNDANDGLAWNRAKKTVQSAVSAAMSGMDVLVASGTYKENIVVTQGIALYGGYDSSTGQRNPQSYITTLDGNGTGSAVSVYADVSADARIDGFTIQNGIGTSNLWANWRAGGGIYCGSRSKCTISNNRIRLNSAGSGGGVYCSGWSCPVIINNVFAGNAGPDGGAIYAAWASPTVVNNTIAGNSSGIHISSASGPVTLVNNLISGNGTGITVEHQPSVTLSHNCVYDNKRWNYSGISKGPTDIEADPRLANLAFGNMHVQPNSPCIDAGDNAAPGLDQISADMDGQPRKQDGDQNGTVLVDIGADESDGTQWPSGPGCIVRVTPIGNDSNDGSSWALAKASIQSAITSVSSQGGGEIWVREGTYNECITLSPYVYLYGGFIGDENTRSERPGFPRANPALYETTVGASAGAAVTAISTGYMTATVDGFTVRNGKGRLVGNLAYGGGIYCSVSSPTIANDRILGNSAWCGGGVFCASSSPVISNTAILSNSGSSYGGGICCQDNSSPLVMNCIVAGNTGQFGGGIYCKSSSPDLINNTIVGNSGGIHCESVSSPRIINNLVAFNDYGVYRDSSDGAPVLRSNDVFGNADYDYKASGVYQWNPTGQNGNISADPLIADIAGWNMHIQPPPNSPCIDAGDNSFVEALIDIDGQPRKLDGDGNGSITVDIGADESDGTLWTPVTVPVIRVSYNGNDANDGSTWPLAKRHVQAGIDAVYALGGGEVWVEGATDAQRQANPDAGKYQERIALRTFVGVYGGFDVDDARRADRNCTANVTILDGTPLPGQQGGSVVSAGAPGYLTSTLDGFTIRNGTGTLISGLAHGGGIFCSLSAPMIANNIITGNAAYLGGGIHCDRAAPSIHCNTLHQNTATTHGAGIYSNGATRIVNNVIRGNASAGKGGGVYSYGGSLLVNNTFYDNTAATDGGGVYLYTGYPRLVNNAIVSGSSGICREACYPEPEVLNNCVYGNTAYDYKDYYGTSWNPTSTYGNISAPPQFVDEGSGDLHLQGGSPCVDRGANTGAPAVDRDGVARPFDGDGDGTATTDIGAHEFTSNCILTQSSPALADLNGDGLDEAIFGSPDGKLHVSMADGTELFGWPRTLPAPVTKAPAVGDIDNDGELEIVVTCGGAFHAFEKDGSTVAGWSAGGIVAEGLEGTPALGDIDGDGCLEAVAAAGWSVAVVDHDGTLLPCLYTGDYTMGVPAVGDLDGDGDDEVFTATECQSFWAYNGDGTLLFSGCDEVGSFNSSQAMADMDGDGKMEAIACTEYYPSTGWVLVLDEDGSYLPGWPAQIAGGIHTTPAVGDIERDGTPEIIVVSNPGKVYLLDTWGGASQIYDLGCAVPSYEYTCPDVSPLLSDLDGDGSLEVFIAWYDGKAHAFETSGVPLAGWPRNLPSATRTTPAIGNMDGDNDWDIVFGCTGGSVFTWEIPGDTSSYSRDKLPWPTFHGDNLRSGAFVSRKREIYVKWNSPGPVFDGRSWATAYQSVQQGLDEAIAGDEVWVAGATYAHREIDPTAGLYVENLTMKNGVALLGGFEGNGGLRCPEELISVLDGNGAGPVVTMSACTSPRTAIEGFTIRNGNAGYDQGYHGGGIRMVSSCPAITSNRFESNTAWAGGGIWCSNSSPAIVGNLFCGNHAPKVEHYEGYGGGIYCAGGAPVIRVNSIWACTANMGAGIYCSGSNAAISDNSICNNSASSDGMCDGGGIYCSGGTVAIAGNEIRGNDAWWGGGISCFSAAGTIVNNEITGNTTEQYAAGLHLWNSSVSVVNNTIAGNTVVPWPGVDPHGGGIYVYQGSPVIGNNIVAFNSSGIWKYAGSTPILSNNDVYGNTLYNYSGLSAGTGDISANPQFANRGSNDYRLLGLSACVDAGTNTGAPATDKYGLTRPVDGNCDGTATCDIGAHEYQPSLGVMRRGLPDGTAVVLHNCGVVAVFRQMSGPDWVYVEDQDRAWGIRVLTTADVYEGDMVHLTGVLRTDSVTGERYIEADPGSPERVGVGSPQPIGMRNKWLGGQGGGCTPAIREGSGFYNVGMSVQTWGAVSSWSTQGYFYINDGANLYDGGSYYGVRVILPAGATPPAYGTYVKVTGISSTVKIGAQYVRAIRLKSVSDIQPVTTWTTGPITINRGYWNALALPGIPRYSQPESVFVAPAGQPSIQLSGSLSRYDAPTQRWIYYDECNNYLFGNCMLGDGYMLYVPSSGSTSYSFQRTPATGDQMLSLPVGSTAVSSFTFAGNPFDASIPWSSCRITDGNSVLTLANALSVGWIHKVSSWNNTQWVDITDLSTGNMDARKGYEIYTRYNNLAVIVPAQ